VTSDIFERANARLYKAGAIEASLSRACRNDGLARAFETGAIPTKKASRGQKSVFERFEAPTACRFGIEYGGHSPADVRRRRRKIAKRTYGSWSDIPPQIRFHYTEAERASLHIVVEQVKRHGFCTMSMQEIADCAGVHRNSVKNALKEAKALGHIRAQLRPRPGQKHLPSIITIVSKEWLDWIAKGIGDKRMSALGKVHKQTRNVGDVVPAQWAFEGENAGADELKRKRHALVATEQRKRHAFELDDDANAVDERDLWRPSAIERVGQVAKLAT